MKEISERIINVVWTEISTIWEWLKEVSFTTTRSIDDIINSESNNPLIKELYSLSKEWEITFFDLINKLREISTISKYDISDTIRYLEDEYESNGCNNESLCSLNFTTPYWAPTCTIYYNTKKNWSNSIRLKLGGKSQ